MPKKAKKTLTVAAPEQCFWTCNGAILKDLKELKDTLKRMDKNTFVYHVNKEKNDFSKWVEEVLGDAELAKKIAKDKILTAMLKDVETHLKKNYAF